LAINANNFGGKLPKCIGNFSTTLTILLLDNNKIFGNIPNGIGNLINLETSKCGTINYQVIFPLKLESFKVTIFGFKYKTISMGTFHPLLEI
jgi:hypothetical protein